MDSSIWFYAGALMIILGSYVVEPFFTKPSDAIVNSIAMLIALLGLNNKNELYGYYFLFSYAVIVLILSVTAIYLKDALKPVFNYIGRLSFIIVETLGKSKVAFSLIYLLAVYSYFAKTETIIAFIIMLFLWLCLTLFDIVGLLLCWISNTFNKLSKISTKEIGKAIGFYNPFLFKAEIDYTNSNAVQLSYGDVVGIQKKNNLCSIGVVVNTKQLLNKQWVDILLLTNSQNCEININFEQKSLSSESNSIYTKNNLIFQIALSELDQEVKNAVEKNELYLNINNFVGFVTHGSNINTINFTIVRSRSSSNHEITEGTILKTKIYNNETLYQVINGNTREERLENNDNYGYLIGIARKLGIYNRESKQLNTSKWIPVMYSPVYFANTQNCTEEQLRDIALNSIGRLPDTDMEIPINDINAIVTHNTAILGILGIGKSCLAFELIKKITQQNIKVICIDITNQYNHPNNGLSRYINQESIEFELNAQHITELRQQKNRNGNRNNPNEWGNMALYSEKLDTVITSFAQNDDKKVLILNPDWHPVTKALSNFNIESTVDLTAAEKTRIISERIFMHARSLGETTEARFLIVYEEAHSLVPEWNSVANEGDKAATNGTAKVILQGRKYGLGCLVITQRTANISKSILNQCNTIFALRVFDDTSKDFLQNYIGQDYTNTLPTLEERHAIAIGKGLKLKQPVIIKLNEVNDLIGP